jgi:hypothetical protein
MKNKKIIASLLKANKLRKPLPKTSQDILKKITTEQWWSIYIKATRGSYLETMAMSRIREAPA